jgi:predicted metalloprotease with PDZ domain
MARILGLVCLLSVPAAAAAEHAAFVEHELSFPSLRQQYVRVVSSFPAAGPELELVMANWNPGSYVIRDFSADVDRIEARDAVGRPLPIRKLRKNAWSVQTGGADQVTVEYDVHAGELSVNTSWASPDFVLINGSSVFLYTDASRPLPQRIRVAAPPGVGQVYTSMQMAREGSAWQAANFDELVDSPMVVTSSEPRYFQQDGHGYQFLNVGHDSLWDTDRAVADVQAVVAAANALWGEVPLLRDYWFLNFLVERGGGLEHDHSTVMMASRWQMREREDYIKWLSLVAHEYFHLWNVRRMRPAGIEVYDFESEQYSTALWLAEGFSSYYDNLLLSRAGLITPDEYFKRLAIDLHRLEMTPGRALISLEQASRDAWIRHYQPDANTINSNISYYTKGAVLGFALDARIRAATEDRKSLDDVMRAMYASWDEHGYPPGAFRDVVEQVAGVETRAWLEPLLSTPADPDIDAALDYFGLQLDRHPDKTAAEAAGNPVAAGLGVNWQQEGEALVVAAVIRGMSGSEAGLLPGDELLAIDGERVLKSNLDDRLARLRPGEVVELTLARRERLMQLSLPLAEARPQDYEISLQENPARRQKRRLQEWLLQDM